MEKGIQSNLLLTNELFLNKLLKLDPPGICGQVLIICQGVS